MNPVDLTGSLKGSYRRYEVIGWHSSSWLKSNGVEWCEVWGMQQILMKFWASFKHFKIEQCCVGTNKLIAIIQLGWNTALFECLNCNGLLCVHPYCYSAAAEFSATVFLSIPKQPSCKKVCGPKKFIVKKIFEIQGGG